MNECTVRSNICDLELSTEDLYRVLHSVFRRHSDVSVFKIGEFIFVLDGNLKR